MTVTDFRTQAPSNWNLPNVLTVARIVFVPVFLWLLLHDNGASASWRWWATLVFCLLMATDKVDGYLARSRGLITDFGKMADPIADKFLMIGALVGLCLIEVLPWWVAIIIIVRELGITLWRLVQLQAGSVVPASQGGKVKTVTQTLAVVMFLIPWGWVHWLAWVVMIAALVVTVVTGVQYILDARKAAKEYAG
ncbi:CDP-diacylglycerol--glycerol-3-phosphate 3-phosphatidyltransferase [Corynebacterium sp. TAE3-ERU12]|uniref:CDP-diacylglycerol--glycerol-3-phosphate 3-phosphatidyltransferase n=1 Tax=Corynebacterium sp. TAE3-ERU12 TaxID=2849491 RepID=UPI001C497763|nr:CDP-diacylglycerol--glycerol-3-phosphate 3-phosphatidyltransferase [Corynebacterium sp. TAE3-ERU12]